MEKGEGGRSVSKRISALLCILILFSFFCSGCYYFSSKKEMANAGQLISELKGMDGAKAVPYEYTSAEKFLEVSREEFNENDFKAAKGLAERSKSAAQAGLSEAKKTKK